jgi:AcrR family transcriptional regulator
MSPRPRKASDGEVFAAAHRVMQQVGPAQVTLGRIAAEAGVTAGALVQRFGSRRGLMLALMAEFSTSAPVFFAQIRAAHPSPLAALRAYAECMAQMGATPQALAHHLAYLQIDLTDPDYHQHMRVQAADTRAELRRLIEDAVAAGELVADTDVDVLTRAVQAVLSGSLFVWAMLREGTAAESVRADIDAVLAPYLEDAAAGVSA